MAARGVAVRSTDRFERKREAILDAATRILNRKGVKGLTLSDAAAAVDLSTTSVTYYFKRKDDLAAACMVRGIEELQRMAEAASEQPTGPARLADLLKRYFEREQMAAASQLAPLPALADILALGEPRRTEVNQIFLKMFRRMRGVFEAPELGWLTRGRKTVRARVVLEQLFRAPTWLTRYDPEDYPRLRERMLDIFLKGVALDGASWTPASIPAASLVPEGEEQGRETFLLAATRLINSRGYKGASVDKISAELNVTKGSFYHHNEAKDDLVVTCFERSFEVIRRAQRNALEMPGDQWDRLSSCAAALAEFQLSEHGPLLRTSALSALPEPIRKHMIDEANRISDRFGSMISDGIAEGSLRPVDPYIAAQMLHATLNACAALATYVPDVRAKAAPAVFTRPMLMGIFDK